MVDPSEAANRIELGNKLTELREAAGITIREVVERSGALHGTVAGWFAGQHVPTKASRVMFNDVLAVLGVDDDSERNGWWAAVTRARRVPGPRGERPPYKGLASFTESDANVFFGRSELVAEALKLLAAAQPLFIVGASGSGKSSLIRAGIIPALPEPLRSIVVKPGDHPLSLRLDSTIDANTVLCVDQFEELWTIRPNAADRNKFLSALLDHPARPQILIGLRADFYSRALEEPRLLTHLQDRCLLVGPLTSESLESAIRQPAVAAGFIVDDDLVRVMLADLAPRDSKRTHDPGALPLLSHALLSTWELAQRRRMTVAAYHATGGLKGAVERSAELAFTELDLSHRGIARSIFRRLVAIDGFAEMRRRVGLAELLDVSSPTTVRDVVSVFADHRLLTLTEDTVEITHEVLLSQWHRLRQWIHRDRNGLVIHRGLTTAAQLWEESRFDSTALLGPARLEVFIQWVSEGTNRRELNNLEKAFLDASTEHQAGLAAREHDRKHKLRTLNRSLAMITVIAVIAAVIAGAVGTYAIHQSKTWQQAKSRQAALAAQQLRNSDPALAAQIAVAAYKLAPTLEAKSALIDATSLNVPVRLMFTEGPIAVRSWSNKQMIVGTVDGRAHVYRLDGRMPQAVGNFSPLGGSAISTIAYSPDGHLAVIGGADGAAIWRVNTPKPSFIARLDPSVAVGRNVHQAAFSPNGTVLAIGAQDGTILRWDVTTPSTPRPLAPLAIDGDMARPHATFAFNADGSRMASSTGGNAVTLWDVTAIYPDAIGKAVLPINRPTTPLAVALSPDGTKLALGSSGNDLYRWDITDPLNPVSLPPLTGFLSSINDVAFTADSQHVAAVSSDQTLRIFDWDRAVQLAMQSTSGISASLQLTGSFQWTTSSGPTWENSVIVGNADGSVHIIGSPELAVVSVARVASPSDVNSPVATNGIASPQPQSYVDATDDDQATRVSPDQRTFVTATLGKPLIQVWDISDPTAPVATPPVQTSGGINALSFSPNNLLAVATASGSVELWTRDKNGHLRHVNDFSSYTSGAKGVAFLGRGHLATIDQNRRTNIWTVSDPKNPRLLSNFVTIGEDVTAIHSSPGGNQFAIAGIYEVQVWDISTPESPRKVAQLSTHGERISRLYFHSAIETYKGVVLGADVTGPSGSSTSRTWVLDMDAAIKQLCNVPTTPVTPQEWAAELPGIEYFTPCD